MEADFAYTNKHSHATLTNTATQSKIFTLQTLWMQPSVAEDRLVAAARMHKRLATVAMQLPES